MAQQHGPEYPKARDSYQEVVQESVPKYRGDLPSLLPFTPQNTAKELIDLGYSQKEGSSPIVFLLIFVFGLVLLKKLTDKKDWMREKIPSLLMATIVMMFLGPITLPVPILVQSTLGVAKIVALVLLLMALTDAVKTKKFPILSTDSFVPLSLYALAILASFTAAVELNAAVNDFTLVATGFLFFFLSFRFLSSWKMIKSMLKGIAFASLFPALISLGSFFSAAYGKLFISATYSRYVYFNFLYNLQRGRIVPVSDIEFALPAISFTIQKTKKMIRSLMGGAFIAVSIAVFLSNFRYRFLVYLIAIFGYLTLSKIKDKGRKVLILSLGFITAFAIYLLITSFTIRVNLINRFMLRNYEYDISSIERRKEMFKSAWALFLQFPVLGVGGGNYQHNAPITYQYLGRDIDPFYKVVYSSFFYPHNWFLLTLAENGAIGFAALIWLLFTFAKIDLRLHRKLKGEKHAIFITLSLTSWLYVIANQMTPLNTNLTMVIIFWAMRGMVERMHFSLGRARNT